MLLFSLPWSLLSSFQHWGTAYSWWLSGLLGSRNRQKAQSIPSGHQRLHLDQHVLNSKGLCGTYIPFRVEANIQFKGCKSCTFVENALKGEFAEQGGNQTKLAGICNAGICNTGMLLKSAPEIHVMRHTGVQNALVTQNFLLRANMGFSSFKSRTELAFKVQMLRRFVLQHSEHPPRKVSNELTLCLHLTPCSLH